MRVGINLENVARKVPPLNKPSLGPVGLLRNEGGEGIVRKNVYVFDVPR